MVADHLEAAQMIDRWQRLCAQGERLRRWT
jgi:hypothetical protein